MPRTSITPPAPPEPPYERDALFRPDGPLNPVFILDMLRSLMRALPHDPDEADMFRTNRMYGALCALSGMYPRDEIEMMYGAAALMSFYASAACYRLGMNGALPNGENSRHITTAGSAIRTFDNLIKGLERRQSRPMAIVPGPIDWSHVTAGLDIRTLERQARGEPAGETAPPIRTAPRAAAAMVVTPDRRTMTAQNRSIAEPVWTQAMVRTAKAGFDREPPPPPAIDGVEPDGSIIVPENPTPEQEAYIGKRIIENGRDKWTDELLTGRKPRLLPIRPGDRIP